MNQITLQLPDNLLTRLKSEADRQHVSLVDLVETALETYLDDEPTDEVILENLRQSMQDALDGKVLSALEVLAELRKELAANADES